MSYFWWIKDIFKTIDETFVSLCLATWSSGSTFLTKLLTHYPGVFLSFEPLVLFSTYDALHDIKAGQARNTLKDIFQCNFTEKSWGRKYLNFLKSPTAGYRQFALHNLRLRSVCEGLAEDGSNKLCYDPEYVQSICSLHPINLVKTVRMRTRQIAPILDEAGTMKYFIEDDLSCKLSQFRSECKDDCSDERPPGSEELEEQDRLVQF